MTTDLRYALRLLKKSPWFTALTGPVPSLASAIAGAPNGCNRAAKL